MVHVMFKDCILYKYWMVASPLYSLRDEEKRGEAESIIAFLRPVNCIVDELPFNICYIIHISKILTMLL